MLQQKRQFNTGQRTFVEIISSIWVKKFGGKRIVIFRQTSYKFPTEMLMLKISILFL